MTHLTHSRRPATKPGSAGAADRSIRYEPTSPSAPIAASPEPSHTKVPESFAVYDALTDIVCITTFDGTLRFLNRAGRDLLGWVHDDAWLGTILPAHTPTARELLLDEVIPAAVKHGRITCDTALQTIDGRVFPAVQTVVVTPAGSGVPMSLTMVIRNVSIERQTAAQLGESQRLFQMVTQTVPDLLYLYDLIDQRVIWMNRCPHGYLGGLEREARTVSRRELIRLVHKDDRALLRTDAARMTGAYGDGDVVTSEVRMRTPGGTWRWMQTRTSVFSRRETGAPLLMVGIATDISAAKKATLRLRAERDTAERANSDRSDMVSRLCDTVSASLDGIIGVAAELELNRHCRLTASELGQLQTVTTRGAELRAVLSDLRDYTRIEAGELSVEQQRFDVSRLVRETVAAFCDNPKRHRVPIVMELPESPMPVLTDPARLGQALTELLAHALARTEEGEVRIRVVPNPGQDHPLAIEIADAGPQMTTPAKSAIFTLFDAASRTTADGGSAAVQTGLGVALTRATCEMIGCSVELITTVSDVAGTVVRITLPQHSRAAELASLTEGNAVAEPAYNSPIKKPVSYL